MPENEIVAMIQIFVTTRKPWVMDLYPCRLVKDEAIKYLEELVRDIRRGRVKIHLRDFSK